MVILELNRTFKVYSNYKISSPQLHPKPKRRSKGSRAARENEKEDHLFRRRLYDRWVL